MRVLWVGLPYHVGGASLSCGKAPFCMQTEGTQMQECAHAKGMEGVPVSLASSPSERCAPTIGMRIIRTVRGNQLCPALLWVFPALLLRILVPSAPLPDHCATLQLQSRGVGAQCCKRN